MALFAIVHMFLATFLCHLCARSIAAAGSRPDFVPATTADPCGSWKFFENSCYKYSSSSVTWDNARQKCELENAALVTIDNSYENDFVSKLSSSTFWIGLNDISQEGVFVWESGFTTAYLNWNTQEPNNLHNEDCVHKIASSTLWNDLSCTRRLGYVCEKGQHSLVVQCFLRFLEPDNILLCVFCCNKGYLSIIKLNN
jgi:hypothetical protein